ncbi:MAG: leucine-rich repeat protein [bacterium]
MTNDNNNDKFILPENTLVIEDYQFHKNTKIKKIILPEKLTKIGNNAFEGCVNLEEIIIPSNVTEIGSQVFKDCKRLKKVLIYSPFITKESNEENNYVNNSLPIEMFKGCNSLEEVTLPSNITTLLEGSFESCYKLKNIPRNIITFNKNVFRNCKSLTEVHLNKDTTYLPESTFQGCIRLSSVHGTKVNIGKKCFKSCISLKHIPQCINSYAEQSFENCHSLLEARNIQNIIPRATFRSCKSLKNFIGDNAVNQIDNGAFENCENLEQFNMSSTGSTINANIFKNCKNLNKIILPFYVIEIDKCAFYGCEKLIDFTLPDSVNKVGNFAFCKCNSITDITIPMSTQYILPGAFSYMNSLSRIHVDPLNKIYHSINEKCLINENTQSIIQYASGNEESIFSIREYTLSNYNGSPLINPIKNIEEYAFAGASFLKELILDTGISYIESSAFNDTEKLKTLIIEHLDIYSALSFKMLKNKFEVHNVNLPFEEVILKGDFSIISSNSFDSFKNIKYLTIPNSKNLVINKFTFSECKLLEKVAIPYDIKNLYNNTFFEDTTLEFSSNIKCKSKYFSGLYTVENQKVYVLQDYCLIEDDNMLLKINLNDIKDYFKNHERIINNPALYIKYIRILNDMNKNVNYLRNGIYIELFKDEINSLVKSNINKEEQSFEILELLLKDINQMDEYNLKINTDILENDYELLLIKFIKSYDTNMHRMIMQSGIFENKYTTVENLKDLLKLAEVLGAFDNEPITRQRATTFISDNILVDKKQNVINKHRIVGDNIHRKFNEIIPTSEINKEFVNFFMSNYEELYNEEQINTGIISRIHNNFEDIAKSNTSNRGYQRKLLVTLKKCIHYLTLHKFNNVTPQTENLSLILGTWYTADESFQQALVILDESNKAPRNIFSKYYIDDDNNKTYDVSGNDDLCEEYNGSFTYQWLPKQDYLNFVLGKYCDCCAHIEGAGNGIMTASMISENHQNLVIKNNLGEIISKSTIYVNTDKNYAVFNNLETNANYNNTSDLELIYETFMRGAIDFLKQFNKNNNDNKIDIITIGTKRNSIESILEEKNVLHPIDELLEIPSFTNWNKNNAYSYNGDALNEQRRVLRRKDLK